jgi:phasin family protein
MMATLNDQFSAATKENLNEQLGAFSTFADAAFKSVEKIIELNLAAAKTSYEESSALLKQAVRAKDPQEFFSLTGAQVQPNADKAIDYARHLTSIIADAQAEFNEAAEARIADVHRQTIALVEEVSKNAPAGSENFVALFKSTLGGMNAGYEQVSKSTKQAMEVLEANFKNAVNQVTPVSTKRTARNSKKA